MFLTIYTLSALYQILQILVMDISQKYKPEEWKYRVRIESPILGISWTEKTSTFKILGLFTILIPVVNTVCAILDTPRFLRDIGWILKGKKY